MNVATNFYFGALAIGAVLAGEGMLKPDRLLT